MKLGYLVGIAALSVSCATTTPERITLENVDAAIEKAKVATAEAGRIKDLYACQEFKASYQKINSLVTDHCLELLEYTPEDIVEQCEILREALGSTKVKIKNCK